jgi:2-C-methyl-D-erythritol 4-phosphate cytidylyltransferase
MSKLKISGLQTASVIMQDAARCFLPLWQIKHFTNERQCFASTGEGWKW